MTLSRTQLIVLRDARPADLAQLESLKSAFDVIEVENLESARQTAALHPHAILLLPAETFGEANIESPVAANVLRNIGEGAAIVDADSRIRWSNTRFNEYDEDLHKTFCESCTQAIENFNEIELTSPPLKRTSRRLVFRSGDDYFELLVSPAQADEDAGRVTAVLGVLMKVTASRLLQSKIDAIDSAGAELMRLESGSISRMNMAERLKLLEEKIIRSVRELLHFDNFEIRLLDRKTSQLELVIAVGISPLKIGEVIRALPENNGISGYVAATGESYVCPDVERDPRYCPGLDHAASSLTVPLKLFDRVIGVFNIESNSKDAFDDKDRQFAEIFGRYIAMAMNILDLLVIERYTANERVTGSMLEEINEPITELSKQIDSLRKLKKIDKTLHGQLGSIVEAAQAIQKRVESVTSGPQTILGAEQELRKHDRDPSLVGKRVLVVDDEASIRDSLQAILTQKGCIVTICPDGAACFRRLSEMADAGARDYDIVLADIKMPDSNGYEVFRAAKAADATLPVIFMSGFGYDPSHSFIRASQEGLDSILFKPFKVEQLLDAMKAALARPG